MAINQSRKNDARSWAKWQKAGAVGKVKPQIPSKSPVIELPADNPERRAQLERKLEEYKERVKNYLDGLGDSANFMAPEAIHESLGSMPYRIYILERLLQDGKIETWSLSKEMAARFDGQCKSFYTYQFDKACSVIKDYVETGGQKLFNGTGLK